MAYPDNEQLSKIETILLQLDLCQDNPEVANRRHTSRLNIRLPLKVRVLSELNKLEIEVYSRNVSAGGIGFISRRHFKTNERIAIFLKVKGQPSRLILARVTFGRYVASGLYEMGAEFLECVKDNQARVIPRHWFFTTSQTKATRGEKTEKSEKRTEKTTA